MNPCKFQAYLTAYVLRDMDQKRLDAVDAHLKTCPECQKKAAELRNTISLLKESFPTEKELAGKGPVLDPERRQKLLMIKPVPKQSAFMHFINKAYRPLRMIAATLICVFGMLVILTAALCPVARSVVGMFSTAAKGATGSSLGGGGGGRAFCSLGANDTSGDSGRLSTKYVLSADGTALVTTDALSSEVRESNERADAPVGGKEKFQKKSAQKAGHATMWFAEKSEASDQDKSTRAYRDADGFDAGVSVNGIATHAVNSESEPITSEPATIDGVTVVNSPVIMRGIYGSRSSGSSQRALAGLGMVSAPEGAVAATPAAVAAPAEIATRPPAPSSPMPTSERLVRDQEVAAPEKPTSSTFYDYRVVNGSGSIARGPESGKDRLRQMEPLKIGAAKPVFTGTPKDIRSPNLEAPGARENKPADYPVVSYERATETRREADSKLKKLGKGNLVMSETAVSAGTLIRGKRESKHAEKKQKEEEVSNKELTLTGSSTFNALVKSDTGELKLTGANTFSGGTTVLDGIPATSDYKLGIRDELKKAKEDKTVDRSDDSYAEPTKEQSRLGGDKKGQNVQLQQMLEEREEAADIRKKPAPPREPLPFNAFVVSAAEPFSTFAMDVDTASYTLTRQALRAGKLPEPERVRLEEIVNAFDYDDTAPDRATFRVYQDGAQSPFSAGYNLLRMGVKGRRIGREEQRPAMLTFVIDVSGSMSQPDRIGYARQALSLLLDQVSANDRIQIIAYSDQAQFVLEPTVATEKARVMAAFNRLQCNGSTNLEEGLRRAYEQAGQAFIPGAENRVILISDGVANLGADSAQEILDKVAANRKQGITCSVFGVGSGTYNDKMLQDLANKGDGVYRFLDSAEEVKTAFVDDLAATLNFIAKDAKIQVEWNPKTVRRYRQMGYEKRKLTKEQFRDDTVDAGEVGSGQSVTALYELELMPDVTPESSLGTVRIRYQRVDNGKVEEIETALVAATVLRPAHQATVPFRVAASAAEFAELLRGSPHAQDGSFENVANYLRPAALERSLDTRVKELLELVTTAASLSK